MSKQGKRKITVELPKTKDLSNRPSVFERLGTKKSSSAKKATTEHCRQWAQHGSCAYGKSCKFASTHTLISPSKQRAANKDSEKRVLKDDPKSRLHSTVVVRSGRSPDGEIDNWDQNDLEYADTDVLEKRRQQLQRELELQLKMDSNKDMRKDKKKTVSSSSSSRSSSSSSVSSSSSEGSTSSSSSGRDAKRRAKKGKLKRNSSSSSECDVPSKKKLIKTDSMKRDKSESKKVNVKKDDSRLIKKHEANKKKNLSKAIGKKSLSPGKKSGGTPPITSKSVTSKTTSKHVKSPQRKERNRSVSPHTTKDKDRDRIKDKEREKEREKERDKDRSRRSRSPKKCRSRSPRQHGSHPKDPRKKDSSERSRPVSPKKQVRRDGSTERHRKRSASRERDRGRDHKDRSLERKKDKHDDKDRHERKDRGRDRNKDSKRDDSKRRGRDRGLGGGRGDKGLAKPNKPMQRLLPRPEERLAALAAISNRALETDKNSTTSKDRQDTHSERGGRKQDRIERDRSNKRERMDSIEREQGEFDSAMDRQYDHGHDHYDRIDDRYDGVAREGERSPGYLQGRDRHYDPGYDMAGPPRGYPEDDDRMYGESMGDPRGMEMGYDDRRPHRDRSWEGRSSMDRERGYMHPHKEWDNEDYRGPGDWGRERHWPLHDPQMNEWGDKEQDVDGWHHRGHPGHRGRMHDDYNRGGRMEHGRNEGNKRRAPRTETEPAKEPAPATQTAPPTQPEEHDSEEKPPIPDDLSEISDDPDDILDREDMMDQNIDENSQTDQPTEESIAKLDGSEKESTQDTSGACEEKESQEGKDEEDVTNLDFEEISDGELEEERTRAGLGDALGVDWASLVADVHRREQTAPAGGARDRWRPERVLSRIGLSIEMAGKDTVQSILQQNAKSLQTEKKSGNGDKPGLVNGKHDDDKQKSDIPTDVNDLHPVAAIQVATEKRRRQRAVLFGSGCEITRGLSARRDLALRRYLCHLPVAERTGQSRVAPQPSLFHAARALLMQAPVSG
ncbi:zinc finger CCCH domain-containing protein 13-like [Maniola jurtina]|uniref:zinc finger CCCH domain-containing protein 13-like n=1 Tax=Maniola jurtina TaxID=191418 RepID=UPI001E68EA4E|nr:zinc finger CCCH domain-containing protein 13-like [Maniola jurtina]